MSDLDSAINSINASAAKAENTATFLDDMSTFDDQSSVTNPNNGQTVASIPKQVKDRTDELFTAAESDINQAVADAEQSATDAQDAADSIGRYQGLWPDSGGSANKGDTYQTQVSGTPTGQYFTALQDTTVDPVGDDVNWREVVTINYTSERFTKKFNTLSDAISSNELSTGELLDIKERTENNGGGSKWEVVPSSSVITNGANVVDCTGIPNASLLLLDVTGDISKYGAIKGSDSTLAAQSAADALGVCLFPDNDESEPWIIDSITTTRKTSFIRQGMAWVKAATPSVLNSPVFILANDNDLFQDGIRIDVNFTSRSAVAVSGVNCEAYPWAKNLTADADASVTTSVLQLNSGIDNFVGGYHSFDGANTGYSNESTPRACSIGATAGTYHIKYAHMTNSGGQVSGGGVGTTDFMRCVNGRDQPIYAVSGSVQTVANLITEDTEEGVVCTGGAEVTINEWVHYGSGSWLMGVDDAERYTVGKLTVLPDRKTGELFSNGLLRTRSANTTSNSIYVDEINFVMRGNQLFKLDIGTVNYIKIRRVSGTYLYDGTQASPLQWARMDAAQSFDIEDWDVKIVDETDAASDIFEMRFLDPVAGKSTFDDVRIYTLDSTQTAYTQNFRATNLSQEDVKTFGVPWQTNIGPYVRSFDAFYPDSINSVPTVGYWHAGSDYSIRSATAAPFRARCTVSGSPGTWVTY